MHISQQSEGKIVYSVCVLSCIVFLGVMFYSLRFPISFLSVNTEADIGRICKQVQLHLKANYFGFDVCYEYGEHLWAPVPYFSVSIQTDFLCSELHKLRWSWFRCVITKGGYDWVYENNVLYSPHRFFSILRLNSPVSRSNQMQAFEGE
jgi:hypothetical protein